MTRFANTGFRVELPTITIGVVIYCGFVGITCLFHDMPVWVAGPILGFLLAWHSSFQHETIHGHPTASRRINALLGWPPLSLWLPYEVYRESHLQHHRCKGVRLTRPADDPESHYLPSGALAAAGRARRALSHANRTLAGRLLLGPAITIVRFWKAELHRRVEGRSWIWLRHVAATALVLAWVVGVCHIPLHVYLLAIVYPSMALGHLRSFAEHQSHADPGLRTNVVESGWLLSLLFLNNNLHVAHHARPSMPWYRLPRAWRAMRAEAGDAGTAIRPGYRHLFRSHFLRPIIAAEYSAT